MSVLFMVLIFIIVLGPMVFIHEFGHFAVAKLLKIKVEIFSLGFGPKLFGFVYGDTDYRVSAVPLGGYVKMKGENLDEEIEGTGDEFQSRPKFHRFLVLVAGPVMNIIMALAIPAGIAMVAFQAPAFVNQPAVVGTVALGSAGEQAGLQTNDRIVRFAGVENPTWRQVSDATMIRPGQPIAVVAVRDGKEITLTLTPASVAAGSEVIGDSGLLPADFGSHPVVVRQVGSGSPAAQAGLQAEDTLVSLNGRPVANFEWFRRSIRNFGDRDITLEVKRGAQLVPLTVKPKQDADGEIRIGFAPAPIPQIPMIRERKPFFEAMKYAWDENVRILVLTKEAFAQIFSGRRNVGDSLAGPIGIAKISSDTFKFGGVEGLLQLMGLLSLNLGVFNLLPIPVLDGGHIFIIFLEVIFGWVGLKVTTGMKEKMMQTGFVLLVLLMGFVIYNDIAKSFRDSRPAVEQPKVEQKRTTDPPPQPAPAPAGTK